jgi:hypothetical protein
VNGRVKKGLLGAAKNFSVPYGMFLQKRNLGFATIVTSGEHLRFIYQFVNNNYIA